MAPCQHGRTAPGVRTPSSPSSSRHWSVFSAAWSICLRSGRPARCPRRRSALREPAPHAARRPNVRRTAAPAPPGARNPRPYPPQPGPLGSARALPPHPRPSHSALAAMPRATRRPAVKRPLLRVAEAGLFHCDIKTIPAATARPTPRQSRGPSPAGSAPPESPPAAAAPHSPARDRPPPSPAGRDRSAWSPAAHR